MNQSGAEAENEHGQPIGPALPDWVPPAFPDKGSLEGRHCRLEPLNVALHATELFEAFALDESGVNWTYLPYGPFPDRGEFTRWLTSVASAGDPLFYALLLKSSGAAVGVASYLRINPEAGSIEIGHIHFSERLKRSPAATEAMFLMMQNAFRLGYRRYEWKCDQLNAASCSAAERLGFSFEGVFRQATIYKGRNRDTAWFAVVDGDWPALEQAYARWLDPGNFDDEGRQRVSLRDLTQPILTGPAFPEA